MSRLGLAGLAAVVVAVVVGGIVLVASGSGEESGATPTADLRNPHPVAGNFKPDETKLASCKDQACYEQAFGNLVIEKGPKSALKELAARMASDPPINSGCHRIAHNMGSAGLLYAKNDVSQAFAAGDSTCWSGYYHGILERALQGASRTGLVKRAQTLCDDDVRSTPYLAYQCVHGLGHGVMIHTAYDLPRALEVCEQMLSDWDATSCDSGVFMENIATGEGSPIKTFGDPKWLKKDDLLYPCNDDEVVPEKRKVYCYLMVTSRVLQANGYKFDGAVKECRRAEPRWIGTCFRSLGRDASGNSRQDPVRIREICSSAGDGERDCIVGAAKDVTSNDASPKRTEVLCRQIDQRAVRASCFAGMGSIIGTLKVTREERLAECRRWADGYESACAAGARA